jgi:hypothetical protein
VFRQRNGQPHNSSPCLALLLPGVLKVDARRSEESLWPSNSYRNLFYGARWISTMNSGPSAGMNLKR